MLVEEHFWKDTPLCNVWLTMLQGMGIKSERHGDSSGVVEELQARPLRKEWRGPIPHIPQAKN